MGAMTRPAHRSYPCAEAGAFRTASPAGAAHLRLVGGGSRSRSGCGGKQPRRSGGRAEAREMRKTMSSNNLS